MLQLVQILLPPSSIYAITVFDFCYHPIFSIFLLDVSGTTSIYFVTTAFDLCYHRLHFLLPPYLIFCQIHLFSWNHSKFATAIFLFCYHCISFFLPSPSDFLLGPENLFCYNQQISVATTSCANATTINSSGKSANWRPIFCWTLQIAALGVAQ